MQHVNLRSTQAQGTAKIPKINFSGRSDLKNLATRDPETNTFLRLSKNHRLSCSPNAKLSQNQWSITKTRTSFCSYCYLQRVNVRKILKKHLWVQPLEKGEKQWVLGVLYPNIYRILKLNFQQNLYYVKYTCLTFNWQKS